MENKEVLNSLTLLAQAFAFAKSGNSKVAGELLVQASVDGNLDDVMDGVAQGAEDIASASDELPENDNKEDNAPEDTASDDDAGAEDDMEITANVELPESVARLASKTLI